MATNGQASNAKLLRGGRDSMSSGDMADELPLKVSKIKKTKEQIKKRGEKKGAPAGAKGGVLGNAPLEKVTSGLKTIFRGSNSSQSGNAAGEINPRA